MPLPSSPTAPSRLDKNSREFKQFAHDIPNAGQTLLPEEYKHPELPILKSLDSITSTTWFATTTTAANLTARAVKTPEILKKSDDHRLRSRGLLSNSERNSAAMESITIRPTGNGVGGLAIRVLALDNTSSRWCAVWTKMRSQEVCGVDEDAIAGGVRCGRRCDRRWCAVWTKMRSQVSSGGKWEKRKDWERRWRWREGKGNSEWMSEGGGGEAATETGS